MSSTSGGSRHVVAVRCHQPDTATLALYDAAVEAVGRANAFLCVDEVTTVPQEWPSTVNVVRITRGLTDELGLRHDLPDVGWRCGDYCYYALARATGFDQAWLIEPDVMFVEMTLGDVVRAAALAEADFVAAAVNPSRPDWVHRAPLADRGVDPVWHCLFALTRASRPAIAAALALRRATQWLESEAPYPNDESVFASAVAHAGLRIQPLEDLLPGRLANFRYSPAKRYVGRLARGTTGPQVVHPALSSADFRDYLARRLSAARRRGLRFVIVEVIDRADDLGVQDRSMLRGALTRGERLLLTSSTVLGPTLRTLRRARSALSTALMTRARRSAERGAP